MKNGAFLILILGGCGGVGRSLAQLLLQKTDVRAYRAINPVDDLAVSY